MLGRVDFPKYKSALKTCLNHIPLLQGPVTRRPGTQFVFEVKDSTKSTRLVRFQFSTTQAYILEFGNNYIRFYKNHGQIQSAGNAVEVVTTYATADLFQLKFTQSADTLYIAHPSYAPRKLQRSSDTNWTLTTISFLDGPYLPQNGTATTMTPSATGPGSVTLTASAITGINNNTGFQNTDVGRAIRLLDAGPHWSWGTITGVTSTTVVTVNLVTAAGDLTAKAGWRLGLWSDTTGYPGAVCFYEDRLVWGGSNSAPSQINGSNTSDYENHAPTSVSGVAANSNAITFVLNSEDVQTIRWLVSNEKGLSAGTTSGEWLIRPTTTGESLSPTNVNAKQSTAYGSANLQALKVGKAMLFVQKAKRKVRELLYDLFTDGFKGPDLTVQAQHVTLGGIVDLAYQQEPQSTVWLARSDGMLLGLTYDRDQDVVGWHRHILGGQSDANGTAPVVESVAVIPEPNGTYDELWVIVRRWINGASHRYIEFLSKTWEDGDSQTGAVYVDCSLTYNGAPATTISGITHLPGETVQVLADGKVHPPLTVSVGGAITLTFPASVVQIGYGYNSDGQTLRNDAGAADGTAQGKTQRAHRVAFRLLDTLGLQAGKDFNSLSLREGIGLTTATPAGQAVPLFTGDDSDFWDGGYTFENVICWRFSQPLPGTILGIYPQQMTQDR